MTPDPFFRSILIVTNRVIAFIAIALIGGALLWDQVCRHMLDISHLDALRTAADVLTGKAYPVLAALFKLTLALAVAVTALVAGTLFRLWRRRAELSSAHVRGPQIQGDV
jgi:hypothetical protein